MGVVLIDGMRVRALLSMQECLPLVADALRALSRGEALLPLRSIMPLPDKRGALATMPGWLTSPPALGVKVISYFPGNQGTPRDCHQGAVLLFDPVDGRLLALLDASAITAIRTAAASGVATQLLARHEVQVLAILGSGVQAETHLDAMLCARHFDRVRIWSRDADHAAQFVRSARQRHAGCNIEIAPNAEAALRNADVICTVTGAREPILQASWIAPGSHLNVVGSSQRTAREVDAATIRRSRLYVDRLESALAEAGDFLIAKQEGAVSDSHIIGEIGDVLEGRAPGRESERDITLFKSLGIAVEDVVAAEYVYRKAVTTGAGRDVDWGGLRT